ncbi:MAG: Gfo/Idh/MocA family oxidoreductase [Candidatus Sumerlaeia bacterium]|nr:Gfo/Idh/MocA family oxidoreductase [Candidatus Sumerlaeia bacterium]
MTTKPIPVAMCGLGRWGPNLLRNLRENPCCTVAALCDRDQGSLDATAPLHPGVRVYTSIGDVAADEGIRAAVVATPAGLHHDHVSLLLESGKDVLVEKPLAMTLGEATKLVDRARELGRILMVGHTFLFNPAVRRVKSEIDNGTLGDLHLILAQRLSLGSIRTDCNALWNLAPHDISILLHWLGRLPDRVSARGIAFHEGHKQEDIALCVLEFPGRVMASIHVSWLNPVKVREMTIVGSNRMLTYNDVNTAEPLVLHDQGVSEVPLMDPEGSFERFQLQVRRGESKPLAVDQAEPLALEVDHFLDCITTRREPIGSGTEALRVSSVLEALDLSLKRGGETVVPQPVTEGASK